MASRNNYFKLVAIIVDIACHVIWRYIKEKIVGPNSFQSFLNKREEKHKLVHLYETSPCCECVSEKINGEKLISRKQLLILYKSDKTNKLRNHQKYAGGKCIQICICDYSGMENIDVNVVDITLANYIIQKCGKHELGIDNWIEQIKEVRNEIFHLSDIQEITDDKFRRKWTTLEGSILGIANLIDTVYAEETMRKFLQTKKLTIIGDYMLKYEILCRDYWKNKLAEFERAQMQEIEKNAEALQLRMPDLFKRSTETDYKKTMKKLETLETMVDKINIMTEIFCNEGNREMFDLTDIKDQENQITHVPVFLQLETPASWDKTKVFDVINEMRLKGTPDMNIRIKAISTDHLNILAEIAKTLLLNVHELRSEINQMMATILSYSSIVTSEVAQVGVNIMILDKAGQNANPQQSNINVENCHIIISEDGQVPLIQQNHDSEHEEVPLIQQNHVSKDGEVPLIQQNHVSEDGEVPLIQQNHVSEDGEVPLIPQNHVSENGEVPLIPQNHVPEDGEVPLIQQNHVSEDGEVPFIQQNHVSKDGEVPLNQQNHVSEDGEVPLIQQNHVSEDGEVPLIQQNHVSAHEEVQLIQQNYVSEAGEVPLIQQNHVSENGEVPLVQQNHVSEDGEVQLIQHNHFSENGKVQLIQHNHFSEDGEVQYIQQNHVSEDREVPLIQHNCVSEDREVPLIQQNHVSEDGQVPLIQQNRVFEDREVQLIQQNHVSEDREVPLIQQNHVSEDGKVPLIQQNHVSEDGEVPLIQQDHGNEILIIVCGHRGNGTSATANTIIGEEYFKSSHTAHKVTETFSEKHAQVYGRKVSVVDTPPLNDLYKNYTKLRILQKEINKYIAAQCQYVILFVIGVSARNSMEYVKDFKILCSYLRIEMQDHVIIMFTRADELERHHVDLDTYLQTFPVFFKEFMRSCGDRYVAFNNILEMKERKKQTKKLLEIIESLEFDDCEKKPLNQCKIM